MVTIQQHWKGLAILIIWLLLSIITLDMVLGQDAGFVNMDRELPRHRMEVEMFNKDGQLFGYSLEAIDSFQGQRVVFISILGDIWIEGAKMKYYLWDLDCRGTLTMEPGDDYERFYRFVMVNDPRKSMGMCLCNINIQLTMALMEIKKG